MTLAEMNDTGYKSTQAEVKKFNKLLANQYKIALDQIRNDVKKIYDKVIGDRSPAELAKLLEEQPSWLWVQANKFNRFQVLEKKVRAEFIKASIAAGNMTVESSKLSIVNNYFKQQYAVMFANLSNVNLTFAALNPAVVEISVLGASTVYKKVGQEALKRISAKFGNLSKYQPKYGTLSSVILNNRVKQLQEIQTAITQGLIQGKSFRQTSQGVKKALDGSASQALRVVRTESMRNMNAGAYANHNQDNYQGLETTRKILSTLDSRTRPQSQRVDLETANENDQFVYPGGILVDFPGNSGVAGFDINDRETVTESIDGQSPEVRRARDPVTGKTDLISYKNYPEWMKDNGYVQNKTGRWVLSA